MMFKLVPIFFILTLLSIAFSSISCQTLSCGNNSFYIQYPFQLLQEGQKPHHHHHEFNLKCNSRGLAVLNIPFSGDFYVRDIDYFRRNIQLYDPGNCLPKRLTNFSLSRSPFSAVSYRNYTFFNCSTELIRAHNFTAIQCLSNSTYSTFATALPERGDEIKNLTGCSVISSLRIPTSTNGQYEYSGFDGDLVLEWIDPDGHGGPKGRKQSTSVLGILMICFIMTCLSLLGVLLCAGCCLRFTGTMLVRAPNFPIRAPNFNISVMEQPHWGEGTTMELEATVGRQIENWIEAATESMIIGGREGISGPNDGCCPICLEECKAWERLRRIRRCDHCFHASCLEGWLDKEITCPKCRIHVK